MKQRKSIGLKRTNFDDRVLTYLARQQRFNDLFVSDADTGDWRYIFDDPIVTILGLLQAFGELVLTNVLCRTWGCYRHLTNYF